MHLSLNTPISQRESCGPQLLPVSLASLTVTDQRLAQLAAIAQAARPIAISQLKQLTTARK